MLLLYLIKGGLANFSLDQVHIWDEIRILLEKMISEGYNIAAIKKKYAEREAKSKKAVSQTEVRRALHNELLQQGRFASVRSPFGRG